MLQHVLLAGLMLLSAAASALAFVQPQPFAPDALNLYQEHNDPPAENRVVGPRVETIVDARLVAVQDPETHRVEEVLHVRCASGISYFLSQDPIGLAGGANLYAYCLNNPLTGIDPEGLVTIYVHGTYSSPQTFDSRTGNIYSGVLDDPDRIDFQWSGDNRASARVTAGNLLAGTIAKARRENPSEPINVIAHSHGGNVAFEATRSGAQIDNLITLGTPGRDDHQPNRSNIGNWYNVYSEADAVQSRGGDAFYPFFQETGPARRHFSAAVNIQADTDEGPLETHSLLSGPQGAVAVGRHLQNQQQTTGTARPPK